MPRLARDEVLNHPRRRLLLDFVLGDPGAGFLELARRTRIAPGTLRHHLSVLARSGWIVERRNGCTLRFFGNDGGHDDSWTHCVLMREPALAALHAWLEANPASPQGSVVQAMARQGWSRSTTQHRLGRLVQGGVAIVVPRGRWKLYGLVRDMVPCALANEDGTVAGVAA